MVPSVARAGDDVKISLVRSPRKAAMIAEGADWKFGVNQVDDNIVMPLVAGAVIWLLRVTI